MAGDVEAGKAFVRLSIKEDLRALRGISKKLKTWGAGLSVVGAGITAMGAGVIGAVAAMANSFSSAGDQLDKMSARTGVSVEQLGALSYAAELSGSSIEDVERAILMMQKRGHSADELGAIANQMAAIQDPAQRTALAMELFGKSGAMMIPMLSGGAAGMEEMRVEAERLGLVLSTEDATSAAQLNDAMSRVKRTLGAVFLQIGSAVAPALTEMANVIAEVVGSIARFVRENKELIWTVLKVAAIVTGVGGAIMGIGVALSVIGMIIGGIVTAFSAFGAVLAAVFSPVGIAIIAVIAGLAGLAAAIAKYTKAGRTAVTKFMATFDNLLGKVMTVVNGIKDAIMAGDLELAGKIAMTGLELAWLEGITALKSKWFEFSKYLVTKMQDAAKAVIGVFKWISSGISSVLDSVLNKYYKQVAKNLIKEQVDPFNELDRRLQEGTITQEQYNAAVKRQYDIATKGQNWIDSDTSVAQSTGAMFDRWESQVDGFADALQDGMDSSLSESQAAAERRIAELRQQLKESVDDASAAAEEARGQRKKKADEVAPQGITSAGTFSAAAARIMFQAQSDDYASRTATATEEIAKRFRTMPKVRFVFEG